MGYIRRHLKEIKQVLIMSKKHQNKHNFVDFLEWNSISVFRSMIWLLHPLKTINTCQELLTKSEPKIFFEFL